MDRHTRGAVERASNELFQVRAFHPDEELPPDLIEAHKLLTGLLGWRQTGKRRWLKTTTENCLVTIGTVHVER